ncbi:MAG: GTPase ObgE, partial [Clostridia bacterium]|nr:GTPase ObgE [Clostridia bacterium]
GGPDGGDGGRGGDLCFVADPSERTLIDFSFQRHFRAPNGEPGKSGNRTGRNAEPLIVRVPVGTVVYDEETGAVMANMSEAGKRKTVLSGGRGGKGNARFAKPTRRAPQFAQPGQQRTERAVRLELKSVADIGLVGFPNVGKSTLLAAVTRATPKIANYHFTTLSPNLGVATVDGRTYVMADIPGLIEGASEGQGLGHEFLRHVERTRMLVHVVDVSGSEGRDPVEDFFAIMDELEAYNPALLDKPMLVAANKTDIVADETGYLAFKKAMEDRRYEVFPISAATHNGLTPLLRRAAEIVDGLPMVELEPEVFDEQSIAVQKTYEVHRIAPGVFEVTGDYVDDLVRRIYPQDRDSIRYFGEQLEKSGIIDALREHGALDGDTIMLGGTEFDFVE